MNGENGFMIQAIIPEIGLLITLGIILIMELVHKNTLRRYLKWTATGGLLVTLIIIISTGVPKEAELVYGGMLRYDALGILFSAIFLFGAILTILFASENSELQLRGEFYILLLISTTGMCLMASSADLIMLFLAIETTSIPLYILAGFLTRDQKSVESGIKYLLFGAMTSAILLYGFSLLYGFTGSTQIYSFANQFTANHLPLHLVIFTILLVLAGIGFKVSAVPFHFWAPDVYEGAPTSVAGFLSTASKAAGFSVLIRLLLVIFPEQANIWMMLVALMAAASMMVGNFLALAQKNIKRLLAYSSIAQAGYMLIGVAANSTLGTSGTIYYLLVYLLTNLAAFGIVEVVGHVVGSDEISSYAGLSRRSPRLAFSMLIVLLSLGGIPPFAGFVGKFLVFASAVQANMVWLAVLGALNTIVALYYYLNILKVIYLYRSEGEKNPLKVLPTWGIALGLCTLGILVLGFIITPLYDAAIRAAAMLVIH